jgi:hypothetical protein
MEPAGTPMHKQDVASVVNNRNPRLSVIFMWNFSDRQLSTPEVILFHSISVLMDGLLDLTVRAALDPTQKACS